MTGLPFHQYHWPRLERGSTVVVSLNTGANVRLMQPSDFYRYRTGAAHNLYGGLVTQSPYRITVPSTGEWYLTIDLWGLRATSVRFSVQVEPAALRPAVPSLASIRSERPLGLVPDESGRTWDVFVSHASEDKTAVAEPLYEALTALGLEVWLDRAELHIGDSLRRRIPRNPVTFPGCTWKVISSTARTAP